ncbi:hypothetical protein [Brevundimonas sp. GCM10030266]|uniref:hypothetical protein n=1 Tax=Brevundimonas sp. GCM10030266 TaxID=3273386 RepID=UPI00360DF3BA
MIGKRPAWMMRAAVGVMLTGLAALATIIVSVWLYRQVVMTAPDILTQERYRHSDGYLGSLWLMGSMFVTAGVVIAVGLALIRLLRLPTEAFSSSSESTVSDFPFNRRPPTSEANGRPGSEGFVDHKLDLVIGLASALHGQKPPKRDEPE